MSLQNRETSQSKASKQSHCQNHQPQTMTDLTSIRDKSIIKKRHQISRFHLVPTSHKSFLLLNPQHDSNRDKNVNVRPCVFVEFHQYRFAYPASPTPFSRREQSPKGQNAHYELKCVQTQHQYSHPRVKAVQIGNVSADGIIVRLEHGDHGNRTENETGRPNRTMDDFHKASFFLRVLRREYRSRRRRRTRDGGLIRGSARNSKDERPDIHDGVGGHHQHGVPIEYAPGFSLGPRYSTEVACPYAH
mmetsp:Transcript_14489/g.21931  ORF Transcript_14489/g.21931 Transcript_14489/m.21931 type:complete len:246 (-) Transcript_14489:358-1095(-)